PFGFRPARRPIRRAKTGAAIRPPAFLRVGLLMRSAALKGSPPMDASRGEEPPPDSTDVAGWKRVVANGLLDRLHLEAVAAALQDLRLNTDLGLRNDLAKNLSDRVYRLLRGQVGRNHPNEGWDIIDRVHLQVFEALAQPGSADAKGLRQAFVPRVLFR